MYCDIIATSVAYLTHTTYSGIIKHNQKIKGYKKMFKIILNKIKELKYYSYHFYCCCKICKFLRLVKIKWLDLLLIYLKEKNLNIILRY